MTKNLPIKQIPNNIYHLILEEFSDGGAVYNDVIYHCIHALEIPQDSTLIIEPSSSADLYPLEGEFLNYFRYIAYVFSDVGEIFDQQFSHAITIKNTYPNTFFFNSFNNALNQCNSLPAI